MKNTMKSTKKFLTLLLTMLLVLSVFTMAGCKKQENAGAESQTGAANFEDGTVLGEGDTVFSFIVVDQAGNESVFEIHTDKATVGEALLDAGIIAGEEGEYGLYVKTVNGITADYDTDGTYWAFYVNDEYAVSGVDTTEIKDGESYSFKVEK